MIIEVEKLKAMPEFAAIPDMTLKRKLDGIESLIRAYTHNNFQNRLKRMATPSLNNKLQGRCAFFKVGDTVQISESINDGVFVITVIDEQDGTITLDKDLLDTNHNLVTKVEYPAAVVDGTINLMLWEVSMREKVGIQSETISRHSVTYFAQDANNQVMGYPATLLGFLKPYMKAKF